MMIELHKLIEGPLDSIANYHFTTFYSILSGWTAECGFFSLPNFERALAPTCSDGLPNRLKASSTPAIFSPDWIFVCANPTRLLPTSNSVYQGPMNTSPRIHRGPTDGGSIIPMNPLKHCVNGPWVIYPS